MMRMVMMDTGSLPFDVEADSFLLHGLYPWRNF